NPCTYLNVNISTGLAGAAAGACGAHAAPSSAASAMLASTGLWFQLKIDAFMRSFPFRNRTAALRFVPEDHPRFDCPDHLDKQYSQQCQNDGAAKNGRRQQALSRAVDHFAQSLTCANELAHDCTNQAQAYPQPQAGEQVRQRARDAQTPEYFPTRRVHRLQEFERRGVYRA